MKTIASLSMTLALAGMSFAAQTATPATTPASPAAKDNSVKTAAVKKHNKKKVVKKSAAETATPAAPAVAK
jgi:hypothetical protein